jgi:protein-S-isoprenylcysteine O-methyltransferase Ste14
VRPPHRANRPRPRGVRECPLLHAALSRRLNASGALGLKLQSSIAPGTVSLPFTNSRIAVLPFPAVQATLWEFRNRWYVISGIFAVAFMLYSVDHVNAAQALGDWLAKWRGVAATDNSYRLIFLVGATLVAIAALIRTWGTSYLQAYVMRDSAVHTERLVADGPYRFVRNPLYLGNILMAVGIGLMASRAGFVVLVVGMTICVLRLLLREEAELLRDQGDSYRRYCAAVPRLFPAVTPRVPSAGNAPRWGQGFRAELMYWLMAAAVAAFAATLNLKVFWAIFAVAFASSWLYKSPPEKAATRPA